MDDNTTRDLKPRGYEFDAEENRRIARTAGLARTWGIISLVIGGLALLGMMAQFNLLNLIQAATAVAIGIVFLNVGKAFMKVVQTEGDDITHILDGVQELGTAFQIQIILTLASFIIGTAIGLMQVTSG